MTLNKLHWEKSNSLNHRKEMAQDLKTTEYLISLQIPKHYGNIEFGEFDFDNLKLLSELEIPGSLSIPKHAKSLNNIICLCNTVSINKFQEALDLLPEVLFNKCQSEFLIDIAVFRGANDFSNTLKLTSSFSNLLSETEMILKITFYP